MPAPRGNPVPAEAPTQSIALFDRARKVIPGGVNSPVRAFHAVGGTPRFIPRIAAVVIEPIPANHGLLLQRPEYLRALREITRKHGSLLIFDEVISGFRVARGGVAQLSGIRPDLATFGKIIGGGMPVGAFGGLRQIMSRLAPEGDTYQAGTLSGNPVAMSAGIAA